MNKNLYLSSLTAQQLYSKVKDLPVFDFHSHLSPKEIYEDVPYKNITEMWLKCDHYKWRAMRYAGVEEKLVTDGGDSNAASDKDRFKAFAKTVEKLAGSPLYVWAQMELQKYFNISEPLNTLNADDIYDRCDKIISEKKLSPDKLIKMSNVNFIATTDDPCDDLQYHKLINDENRPYKVSPTFRPDMALKIEVVGSNDGLEYIKNLGKITGINIDSAEKLIEALSIRLAHFIENGCLSSDHSVEMISYDTLSDDELNVIFNSIINQKDLSLNEIRCFKMNTLARLAKLYHRHNCVMQLHIGALRNNNSRLFASNGADTGCDSPNDFILTEYINKFLNTLDRSDSLPKTILYCLNAKDYISLSTAACNFPKENVNGNVQLGAAWWHLDHKSGIDTQLEAISSQGMLHAFTGMLTDSRSFTSFTRHDYFRRILCAFLAKLYESGECEDISILEKIAVDICYKNANTFFNR